MMDGTQMMKLDKDKCCSENPQPRTHPLGRVDSCPYGGCYEQPLSLVRLRVLNAPRQKLSGFGRSIRSRIRSRSVFFCFALVSTKPIIVHSGASKMEMGSVDASTMM